MSALDGARNFFLVQKGLNSEELLMHMGVFTMMKLIPFGNRMSKEAQEHAIECRLLGKELESNAVAKDVTTIQKNLNSLTKAYKLAMN
jgi:hypothetical protein